MYVCVYLREHRQFPALETSAKEVKMQIHTKVNSRNRYLWKLMALTCLYMYIYMYIYAYVIHTHILNTYLK